MALTPVDSPISSWLDEQYHVHSPTNDVMSRHGEVPSRHGDVTKSHGDVTSSLGVFASRHGDIKHTSGLSAPVKTGSPSSWEYPAIGNTLNIIRIYYVFCNLILLSLCIVGCSYTL